MKTAFIGHRKIFAKDIDDRLMTAIQSEIESGCVAFTMGMHGDFDRFALSACKSLRQTHKELEIEVVLTSLNAIKKDGEFAAAPYSDVKTVMFDIEDIHYKRRITLSNRHMLDNCDSLICYVNTSEYRSGAKTALRYAERRGLKIINLFREEDKPFYGMTKEQIDEYWQAVINKKEPFKGS